jgi:hypothetical protein
MLVEGPATFGNRRPRGHDVVDDQHGAAFDHLPPALTDREGAGDVGPAVLGRQPRLVADRAQLLEHREHRQVGGQAAVPDGSRGEVVQGHVSAGAT